MPHKAPYGPFGRDGRTGLLGHGHARPAERRPGEPDHRHQHEQRAAGQPGNVEWRLRGSGPANRSTSSRH